MKIKVSCYAGYRGEESPRSFRIHEKQIQIVEILDQWLAPDHRYFKVDFLKNLKYQYFQHIDSF